MNLPTKPLALRRDLRVRDNRRELVESRPDEHVDVEAPARAPLWRRVLAGLLQLAIVLALLFAAYKAYHHIIDTAPVAERTGRERVARLVETVTVAPAVRGPRIEAWGSTAAAQTLIVRPEISGTVTWVDPEVTPGGLLRKGAVVARLDDRELKLAVVQAEAAIASIDARIQLERGQAEIGKRELTRLDRNLTPEQRSLVLREPQMRQLEAERETAVAILEQARIAAARATVTAPFDALVIAERVAPGAMLTQGAEAATLVAADRFHVTLAVPASTLNWIDPAAGAEVRLTQPGTWPEGAARTGRVIRRGSTLTETGRMAELIVEVADPLALRPENRGEPVLLLGAFVRGIIEGAAIEGGVALDRAHLRDGDTVWVMTPDDTLEIRQVEVAWRGPDQVLIRAGLAPGERVVATPLATVAPGMALRTRGASG